MSPRFVWRKTPQFLLCIKILSKKKIYVNFEL